MNGMRIAVAINEHALDHLEQLAGENQNRTVDEATIEAQLRRLERSRLAREYLQWVGDDHRAPM